MNTDDRYSSIGAAFDALIAENAAEAERDKATQRAGVLLKTDRKPPEVPASHPTQRYFLPGPGYGGMSIYGKRTHAPVQHVRVFRDALDDCVEMSIRSVDWGETNTYLDALELRIIAAALLDAAHDIETNPAAALRQTSATRC